MTISEVVKKIVIPVVAVAAVVVLVIAFWEKIKRFFGLDKTEEYELEGDFTPVTFEDTDSSETEAPAADEADEVSSEAPADEEAAEEVADEAAAE